VCHFANSDVFSFMHNVFRIPDGYWILIIVEVVSFLNNWLGFSLIQN
jgi:hypothetical protein